MNCGVEVTESSTNKQLILSINNTPTLHAEAAGGLILPSGEGVGFDSESPVFGVAVTFLCFFSYT